MLNIHLRTFSLLAVTSLLCAACAGATVVPTPQATNAPQATDVPAVTNAPQATNASAATDAPVATDAPAATDAPVAPAAAQATQGETVLNLAIGSGKGQVGLQRTDNQTDGPHSFRIGSDGSIRLLDSVNKRLLFFAKDGTPTRTLAIAGTSQVIDFIVNNAGDVFVLATLDDGQSVILHYNAAGAVVEQIPLSDTVGASANGVILTSQGWLTVVAGNSRSWIIRRNGIDTPPNLQALTEREAVATPRSPTLFTSRADAAGMLELGILAPTNDALSQAATLATQAPASTTFFNVDRAMNLYSASDFSQPQLDFYRIAPDGSVLGTARLDSSGCLAELRSWRSYYIDQTGNAWGLCATANRVTLTRYLLRDQQNQPLPAAPPAPANKTSDKRRNSCGSSQIARLAHI